MDPMGMKSISYMNHMGIVSEKIVSIPKSAIKNHDQNKKPYCVSMFNTARSNLHGRKNEK